MRLRALLPAWLTIGLAAAVGGCGYDFDAAFSEADASPDQGGAEVLPESSSESSPEDVVAEQNPADAPVETSAADVDAESDSAADASQCTNGKQDGDETGVDCGGSCASCPAEVCTNQSDDDHDGKIDCADDDCGEYECVAASGVAGWIGPVMVQSGTGCEDGQPPLYAGGWGGEVQAPSCTGSTCACLSPDGQDCAPPTLTAYDDPGCAKAGLVYKLAPGLCVTLPGATDGLMLTPGAPVGGSCAATGTPGVPGQVHWAVPTVVCGVGAGCSNGGACTTPPASWGSTRFMCVVREGDHACPPGWTLQGAGGGLATELPTDVQCAPCACGAPTGGVCMGQVADTFGSLGCNIPQTKLLADGQCQSTSINAVQWTNPAGFPEGSSCAPSPSKVQGPLLGTGFLTVCCLD